MQPDAVHPMLLFKRIPTSSYTLLTRRQRIRFA
jgi:hypothetical protein